MKKWSAIVLILAVSLVGLTAPVHAKTFKSCTDLRKAYKFGVAQAVQFKNKGDGQIEAPRVNRSVYLANKKLDVDKDGIACEVQRHAAGRPAPTPAPAKPPQPITLEPISLDNLDPQRTWKEASARVRAALKPFDASTLGIRYVLAPSVSPEMVAREKVGIDRIAGLWSGYFSPVNKVRFVYVSPSDGAHAAKLVESENLGSMYPGSSLRSQIENNGCRFANATLVNGLFVNMQCLHAESSNLEWMQTGPHEYTHFVQYQSAMMPNSAACWVTEGMATFYGMSVGWWDGDPEGQVRERFFKHYASSYKIPSQGSEGYRTFVSILRSGDPSEFAKVMRQLEPVGCGASSDSTGYPIGYLLGGMAFEALVASKGHESVLNYLRDFTVTRDWRASFLSSFGISVEDFYVKLAPYAAKTINW
jgi:hypothetical protein